jgi:hypothetical protein
LQRKANSRGYFGADRFAWRDGDVVPRSPARRRRGTPIAASVAQRSIAGKEDSINRRIKTMHDPSASGAIVHHQRFPQSGTQQ